MLKNFLIILSAILLLTDCSRGFDRGALQQELKGKAPQVTDQDIKQALELKPNLTFPARIAVYLKDKTSSDQPVYYYPARSLWRWEEKDKLIVDGWREQLKNSGIASDLILISRSTVLGNDLRAIRLAAAQHGADAVLVVDGLVDVDKYGNPLAFFYIAIVTGFFVPGTHADALAMVNGALWDVRNQYLYLTAESEALTEKVGPAFFMRDRTVVEEAKSKALENFGREFLKRMMSISGKKE